ncbi:hypothetical protein NDI39_31095 [Microcoleus sp. ZQ-A2]|nr:hypothetical protein [Microcoleus sp. FACHB-1]
MTALRSAIASDQRDLDPTSTQPDLTDKLSLTQLPSDPIAFSPSRKPPAQIASIKLQEIPRAERPRAYCYRA